MERIGVGLALIVALCWGSADIVATVAARRQGTFVTTLLSLIASSTVLMAFGSFTLPQLRVENGFSPTPSELGLALLAVVFLHDSLSFWQAGMMVVVFVGLICASFDPAGARMFVKAGGTTSFFKGGIRWGLLAMLSFGAMLFSIGLLSASWGCYLPSLFIRTIAALTLSCCAVWSTSRSHHTGKTASSTATKPPRLTAVGIGLAMIVGVLEITGLLIYSLDTQLASTSLASVLSSSWGILPLLAGIVLFRERPLMQQRVGIMLVMGGLFLLAVKPV